MCSFVLHEYEARASRVLAGGMVTMACQMGKSPCEDMRDGVN